ncbi:pilin [Ramlibacter sp. XY19]|uniref:pilin n=1 Tax=Ramlibacter paludis TaxID=2908000 RepID=UPI0023DBF274|nr:pilin [Ramlibacter paludis]MCG2593722.1 pilin [Ramlibacter paludis]
MKSPRGFTLIELMVVVSIAVLLMLVTLPNLTDKAVREQVAEALPLADIAKAPIELAWRASQPLPADNAAAGLPAADKIVNQRVVSVTVAQGAIHILFGGRAHKELAGKVLTVRPAGVEDARIVPLTWLCGNTAPPDKMIALGQNRTDLPLKFLPAKCR